MKNQHPHPGNPSHSTLRLFASRTEEKENPPPFGTWPMWYGAVLGLLAMLICLFYAFTVYFRHD